MRACRCPWKQVPCIGEWRLVRVTWLGERVDEGRDLFQCRRVTLEVGDVRDAIQPAQSSTRD